MYWNKIYHKMNKTKHLIFNFTLSISSFVFGFNRQPYNKKYKFVTKRQIKLPLPPMIKWKDEVGYRDYFVLIE